MNKIQTPGRHPFSIPVKGGQPIEGVRLVGNQSGKTLMVTAGVHGDEYVGIQAVRELLAQLSPGELSGQVIFVPVVNAGGFFAGTYRVPEDGENLNRCFPGVKGETYTWNMASVLEAALYPQTDFLLDLHGGGIYETMEPLAFFPVDAGERVKSVARQAGQALSLTLLVQSFARDGLYSWAAQQGIPGLLVERGGGGTWSRAEVDAARRTSSSCWTFWRSVPMEAGRERRGRWRTPTMKPYRPTAIGIPKSSRETLSPRENFWAVWKAGKGRPCRPSPPPLTAWCCTKPISWV
mgnify:CR=1 FL=1